MRKGRGRDSTSMQFTRLTDGEIQTWLLRTIIVHGGGKEIERASVVDKCESRSPMQIRAGEIMQASHDKLRVQKGSVA